MVFLGLAIALLVGASSAWATQVEALESAQGPALLERWPSAPFVRGPYTGAPTETEITVSWTADPALAGRVEYARWEDFLASGELAQNMGYRPPLDGTSPVTAHVRLEHLEPNSRYAYRVVLAAAGEESPSPVGTFYTAPSSGEPVRFAVVADTHADTQWQGGNQDRTRLVADVMASDPHKLQFVLHAGDLVEAPTARNWDLFFASWSSALLRSPLLPVIGNHELNDSSYYRAFDLPPGGGREGKQWWAMDFGDAVVVGLDTNVRRPIAYREQERFLREWLSGDHRYRFVTFHHPVFTSDAHYRPGVALLQSRWHGLFAELGVDIVFSGHAHNYERIKRDGVTYLVVGGGGALLRPLDSGQVTGSVVGDDNHLFYVRVLAAPHGIDVTVVAVARQLDDGVVPGVGVLDTFRLAATTKGTRD